MLIDSPGDSSALGTYNTTDQEVAHRHQQMLQI
jgi:hypothetical protein